MLAQPQEHTTPPRAAPPRTAPLAATDLVALWFVLARRSWTSLAVVPADPHGSSEELVRSMVDTASRLSEVPVTAITMKTLDAPSARRLADLQRYAQREGPRALVTAQAVEVAATLSEDGDGDTRESGPEVEPAPSHQAQLILPGPGRVVIAIPSVIVEPMGLAVTQASSLVVVAIELGRSSLADANRTIDLIGRERIAGCVLV
jgi:hypothetical protein